MGLTPVAKPLPGELPSGGGRTTPSTRYGRRALARVSLTEGVITVGSIVIGCFETKVIWPRFKVSR